MRLMKWFDLKESLDEIIAELPKDHKNAFVFSLCREQSSS
jgi:hypothetical protein